MSRIPSEEFGKIQLRLLQLVPLLFLLVFWQLFSGASDKRAFYFSTPLRVISTLIEDITNGSLLSHMFVTGGEAIAGFILGNLIGGTVGLLLWYSRLVAEISRPYLVALGAIPVFALGPMTIIWFGIGIEAKIALAFFATVFVAATQAFKGAEEVNPLYIRRFAVFGATRRQIFRKLLIPSASSWVVSSLRLTIGLALLGAFIGEFISSSKGLGYMIVRAGGLYDTSRVIAGIVAIVVIAMLLDKLVLRLEHIFLRWQRSP